MWKLFLGWTYLIDSFQKLESGGFRLQDKTFWKSMSAENNLNVATATAPLIV